jgi:hypothetical protein
LKLSLRLIDMNNIPNLELRNHFCSFFYSRRPTSKSSGALGSTGNRKPRSGYKVIFVPFAAGRPAGQPVDVLTGFNADREAFGRPVGVAIDRAGSLLVADDVGNVIWRVGSAPAKAAMGN